MKQKLAALRSFVRQQNADAILLSSPISINYYTNFSSFSNHEREGFVLVCKNDVSLFTSTLYAGAVKQMSGITPQIYSSNKPFSKLLKTMLTKEKINTLGVEENNLTLSEALSLKKLTQLKPLTIRHLRVKKTDKEIAMIRKACTIADKALAKLFPTIKPGMTEKQIALQLEIAIMQHGGDIGFSPIVAFGANSAIPHHKSGETKLKSNDVMLIDFGAKYQGYCSDMTRTFFVGKSTEEQKKVHQTVLESQQKAIAYLKSSILHLKSNGMDADKVDEAARDYIVKAGFPTIPHSLGHGIGLEVHESPALSPAAKDSLIEGMVFSIEPGIYLDGNFGVRIEDLFAIQNGNLVKLTNFPTHHPKL